MEDRKKTELAPKDKHLFDNLGDKFASAEEKYFFEKMKYKIEFEPAMSNDLIMSENDNEDGIYMQIEARGEGKSMIEMAKEQSTDSTISKTILCRFFEYDIESGDTITTNKYSSSIVDKMLVKYIHRSRRYQASFTEGRMVEKYKSTRCLSLYLIMTI